jgi:hypothetical protein
MREKNERGCAKEGFKGNEKKKKKKGRDNY